MITKTADPQSVAVGGQVTFNIVVRNSGRVDLIAIEVTDIVPDGMTYVPNSASDGGTYTAATRSIDWSVAGLHCRRVTTVELPCHARRGR